MVPRLNGLNAALGGGDGDWPTDLLSKKSGNIFRVGIFLDFVRLTTRTPHGAYVRGARRNRIDRHGGEIERLATRTVGTVMFANLSVPSSGLTVYLPRAAKQRGNRVQPDFVCFAARACTCARCDPLSGEPVRR